MRMSWNFIVRMVGMSVLAYLGLSIGQGLSGPFPTDDELLATQLLTLAGAGLGLLTTPSWTLRPLERVLAYIKTISISEFLTVILGALLGLLFGVLLTVPLVNLPRPFGQFLPIIVSGVCAYVGILVMTARKRELITLLKSTRQLPMSAPQQILESIQLPNRYLVDTSAIIDGRISGVTQQGFLEGTLLVPRFVLNELQMLADSADEMRRTRGRRGLEILNVMQKQSNVAVEIVEADPLHVRQVDEKLVLLARQYSCPIITNDHNLGKVAELQHVRVLNLNKLADALRPPVVTGQDIRVVVRDVGRERDQGVSFLDDGTMIVIEDARRLIGQEVSATVTRVYQTGTGRIVFAQLDHQS